MFLVHLDQRSIWTIAITWRPSSVVCCLSSVVCKLFTFQASSLKPLGRLEPNLAGMFLGWSSTKLLFFVPVGYSIWLPRPIICSDWPKFQRCFFSETNELTEPKLYRNDHWNVLYQVTVFYADRKSKMAAIAGHRLTLDPMGKCSNAFFSETTDMIKAKLYMNVHWMVLYNLKVFCSDMKFKMAATAGLSLTLDPMGIMFQNASSLKPLGQLKPNCPGMIIGRSSIRCVVFMPITNPRWPPPQDID